MDAYEDQDGIAELMSEPPGGYLHGVEVRPTRDGAGHSERIPQNGRRPARELGVEAVTALDMTGKLGGDERGYIAHAKAGRALAYDGGAGLTAHRGVLHPDEWVDHDEVVRLVEGRLGCSVEEARQVYGRTGGGPLPRALHEPRARLDALMAGIAARGGNLALLAHQIGVPERNLQRAAKRGA